jgi:hypothetical protein
MNRDVHLKVGGDVMITLCGWTCTTFSFLFLFTLLAPMLRSLRPELTHIR